VLVTPDADRYDLLGAGFIGAFAGLVAGIGGAVFLVRLMYRNRKPKGVE